MPYIVRCQSASGRTRDIRVTARSESAATRAALAIAESDEPGAGWRAVWALS